ncbi:BnaCnng47500D [Brassica napus]|uniref:BnaCnng47500D protein n=1 Tax=Brassica napus TaxID=3708 RepID=A0A078JGA0_BRANA|nr:BnaCnng47500D [Brassica napus]
MIVQYKWICVARSLSFPLSKYLYRR